jgi:beta-glucosidase
MRYPAASFLVAVAVAACSSPPPPAPMPALPTSAATVPAPRTGEAWEKRHAAQLAAARAGGHRLAFVGDSITQGWESVGKAHWLEWWEPRAAINLGISGDRTQHVLWRLDDGVLAALAGPANDVRAVVVMIGTNNSNGSDHTAEEIAAGIVAVVQRLRQGLPQAKVLLLHIFPRGERPNPQRDKCAEASRLAAAALAGDPQVVARDIGDRFLGDGGALAKEIMPDALHLSAAAYRLWAEAIVADVDRMLR